MGSDAAAAEPRQSRASTLAGAVERGSQQRDLQDDRAGEGGSRDAELELEVSLVLLVGGQAVLTRRQAFLGQIRQMRPQLERRVGQRTSPVDEHEPMLAPAAGGSWVASVKTKIAEVHRQ